MEKHRSHHLLFPKRLWRAQKPTRELSGQFWLKVPLYDDAHAELHANVSSVPVPDWNIGEIILRQIEPVVGDYFKSVDNLLQTIDRVSQNHRSDPVQRNLGQLMIMAIDLQRPYVVDGLVISE